MIFQARSILLYILRELRGHGELLIVLVKAVLALPSLLLLLWLIKGLILLEYLM